MHLIKNYLFQIQKDGMTSGIYFSKNILKSQNKSKI